jgi:hypothetical protein
VPRYFPIKRVVVMVVTILADAISWGLNIQQVWFIPINYFLIIISFIFLGITIWVIWDLCVKIQRMEDVKPSIEVKPESYDRHLARLRIHNKGGTATFKAKIGIIRDSVEHPLHNMQWESYPNDTSCIIHHDGTEYIKVGEICSTNCISHDPLYPICRSGIMLWMNQSSIGGSIPEIVEKYKQKKRDPSMFKDGDMPIDNCFIKVEITSDPSPLKDFGTKYYSIEIEHEQDDKLLFTELSESRIVKL